jgi:hypothetical protein
VLKSAYYLEKASIAQAMAVLHRRTAKVEADNNHEQAAHAAMSANIEEIIAKSWREHGEWYLKQEAEALTPLETENDD